MSLSGVRSITLGVPDVAAVQKFYEDFGLTAVAPGRLATAEGGEQLTLIPSERRRLVEVVFGAGDVDDVQAISSRLQGLGASADPSADTVAITDPGTHVRFVARVMPALTQTPPVPAPTNWPGLVSRVDQRAAVIGRHGPVRPRRLGHVVVGSTDHERSEALLTRGFGLKVSDLIKDAGAFLRCSTDHHNVLVQAAPVPFVHHTSWQVDDVDEVGRGATSMLEADPARHAWGLGRHHIGSNFFWYLRDPVGNFAEYYSDMDVIEDAQAWEPGVFEGIRSIYSWGQPPPPSFLNPEDLGALMTGAHQR
jgi:catechol 2,3-dioxygenase-like lactoylglutathione lyase family enzyme